MYVYYSGIAYNDICYVDADRKCERIMVCGCMYNWPAFFVLLLFLLLLPSSFSGAKKKYMQMNSKILIRSRTIFIIILLSLFFVSVANVLCL